MHHTSIYCSLTSTQKEHSQRGKQWLGAWSIYSCKHCWQVFLTNFSLHSPPVFQKISTTCTTVTKIDTSPLGPVMGVCKKNHVLQEISTVQLYSRAKQRRRENKTILLNTSNNKRDQVSYLCIRPLLERSILVCYLQFCLLIATASNKPFVIL